MRTRFALALASTTATLLVGGCGTETSGPAGWRGIDPCALANAEQAAQTAQAAEDSAATAPSGAAAAADNEKSCTWSGGEGWGGDPAWSVRIRLSAPHPEPTLEELESSPDGSPYFSRSFAVGDRRAYVVSEGGMNCSVVTLYSDAWMAIDIGMDATNPDSGTTDIFADNPSCDLQKPFLESVVGRVGLT